MISPVCSAERRPRRHRASAARVVLTTLLVACTNTPASGRAVHGAWARPADAGTTGGGYVTLVNFDSIPVTLVGASSAWAQAVEVHETMQHDGMAHMMARPEVVIGARDSVVMAPGGMHLMLVSLTRALVPGDQVPLTLRFAGGDSLVTTLPVRAP